MSEFPRHSEHSLDDYLDGRLSSSDRLAFEARLAADPGLRAQLQCQRSIESSLRRTYAPTLTAAMAAAKLTEGQLASSNGHAGEPVQPEELGPPITAEEPAGRFHTLMSTQVTPIHLVVGLGVVAVLALLTWTVWTALVSPAYVPQAGAQRLSPYEFYLAQVNAGFQPSSQCRPDQLALITQDQLGQAVTYSPPTEAGAVEFVGTTSGHVLTARTVAVLARVQGQGVVVLIDQAASCGGQHLPEDSGLYLHERNLGGLVLYEISPLPTPGILPLFRTAAADARDGAP